MPVTKTAKRALRSSHRKTANNKVIVVNLDIATRTAKKVKTLASIKKAFSVVDRAAKKGIIHKNKASRIKSALSKLLPKGKIAKSKSKKTK